jgi:hypothetical protein
MCLLDLLHLCLFHRNELLEALLERTAILGGISTSGTLEGGVNSKSMGIHVAHPICKEKQSSNDLLKAKNMATHKKNNMQLRGLK